MPPRKFRDGGAKVKFFCIREEGHSGMKQFRSTAMYVCMYVRMYVWVSGCMDVWVCGCMDVWILMDGWMDGWMDAWMDGCMDGWMDGWMYV